MKLLRSDVWAYAQMKLSLLLRRRRNFIVRRTTSFPTETSLARRANFVVAFGDGRGTAKRLSETLKIQAVGAEFLAKSNLSERSVEDEVDRENDIYKKEKFP